MGQSTMEIVDDLKNKSHTITDKEYQNWIDWPQKVPSVQEASPEAKADYEKVERLIKEHQEHGKDNPPAFTQPEFDADHPDTKPKPPVTEGMPPQANTKSEKNDVVVSTQALRDFDGKIKQLNVFVNQTRDSLALVNIRPGTFGAGGNLHNKVQVTLLGESLDFLKRASESLIHLRTDVGELILQYDTAEEWNKLTTQQLNDIFRESFADIKGFQKSDPGAGAGGGGSGDTPPVAG